MKTRISLLFVLFISVALGAYSQSRSAFIKFFLQSRNENYLKAELLSFTEYDVQMLKVDYCLSEEDSLKLMTAGTQKNLRKALLDRSMKLINEEQFNRNIDANIMIDVVMISSPVVIDKGKRIIIKVETYCGGLCGEGLLLVYEKEKEGFRLVKDIALWMS